MKKYKDIGTYIRNYPKNVQVLLKKMRATIQKAAPKAEEAISYGVPTFKLNGNLVHFGAGDVRGICAVSGQAPFFRSYATLYV